MVSGDLLPVAIFAYNRPEHLRVTLEALSRCDGFDRCRCYVYCDHPRNAQAAAQVEQTRLVARAWAEQHGAQVIERPANLGFDNIVQGISETCQQHGRAVIVEDDIYVAPDFLRYMRAALDRYADEPRVYAISGYMYPHAQPSTPPTFFLPTCMIWGWATWERAWQRYSRRPAGWEELLADPARRRRFNLNGSLPYDRMLETTMRGRLNTWDIQWAYTIFNDDALGLHPCRPLTWNTGVGGGVHGLLRGSQAMDHRLDFVHGSESRMDFDRPRLDWPIAFPDDLQVSEAALDHLSRSMKQARSWPRVCRRTLQRAWNLLRTGK